METFSALLALCVGNSPATGEIPSQRPVTGSFDVFFDLRVNKRLSKQSWGWWFETPPCSLWRHCNARITDVGPHCCRVNIDDIMMPSCKKVLSEPMFNLTMISTYKGCVKGASISTQFEQDFIIVYTFINLKCFITIMIWLCTWLCQIGWNCNKLCDCQALLGLHTINLLIIP